MIKALKEILIKIARLSKADQRWVLQQLSERQTTLFNQKQGKQLLQESRRFRKLTLQTKDATTPSPLLPFYCQNLAHSPSLYIAIILEQGKFSWEKEFLQGFDPQAEIKEAMANSLPLLKDATKKLLFEQWQLKRADLSFATYLEQQHD